MTDAPTPPPWGSPPPSSGDDWRTDEWYAAHDVAAPQSWLLRQDVDGSIRPSQLFFFNSIHLGIVTGTEQDAMSQLFEIVVKKAETLIKPQHGYQITQEGTTLVLSAIKTRWNETYPREFRFAAARILVTVPPVEKPK